MQPGSALKELPVELESPRVRREAAPAPRAWKRDEAAEMVALHFDFIWRLLRRMGVATKRLSSLRWRISTRANPTLHMPEFIRFIPISPGMRKSI